MNDISLIQIKVNKNFKDKLENAASDYDLPVSSFIKVIVGDFMRNKRSNILTENGFTIEEEKRILMSVMETEEARKNKTIRSIGVNDFLNALND